MDFGEKKGKKGRFMSGGRVLLARFEKVETKAQAP